MMKIIITGVLISSFITLLVLGPRDHQYTDAKGIVFVLSILLLAIGCYILALMDEKDDSKARNYEYAIYGFLLQHPGYHTLSDISASLGVSAGSIASSLVRLEFEKKTY